MGKKDQKKLSFDKIKIAKLTNTQMIVGGFFNTTRIDGNGIMAIPPALSKKCFSSTELTSTKTNPIGYTGYCE